MDWVGEFCIAPDGRQFAIFSELIRGEPRWYWAEERRMMEDSFGHRHRYGRIPGVEGSEDRRVVMRRVEAYVKKTTN